MKKIPLTLTALPWASYILIVLMPLLFLTACTNGGTTVKEASSANKDIPFETIDLSKKNDLNAVDFTSPEAVVEAIFSSARSRDLSVLPKLCDSKGKNDERTTRICNLLEIDRMLFIVEFENGKVLGDAVIEGDKAKVPYVYGFDGSDVQTMELIKRDGQWYLYRFFAE